jgi:hypothetical protein
MFAAADPLVTVDPGQALERIQSDGRFEVPLPSAVTDALTGAAPLPRTSFGTPTTPEVAAAHYAGAASGAAGDEGGARRSVSFAAEHASDVMPKLEASHPAASGAGAQGESDCVQDDPQSGAPGARGSRGSRGDVSDDCGPAGTPSGNAEEQQRPPWPWPNNVTVRSSLL